MLPLPGAAPTPNSNIGDISGNYEHISKLEICYPFRGQPPPSILICAISLAITNGFVRICEEFV